MSGTNGRSAPEPLPENNARDTLKSLRLLTAVVSAATKHARAAVNCGDNLNGIEAFQAAVQHPQLSRHQLMSVWSTLTLGALVAKMAYEEPDRATRV